MGTLSTHLQHKHSAVTVSQVPMHIVAAVLYGYLHMAASDAVELMRKVDTQPYDAAAGSKEAGSKSVGLCPECPSSSTISSSSNSS